MDITTNLVIQLVLCIILFALIYSLMRSTSGTEKKINNFTKND